MSAAPASPACRTFTLMPVCLVNAASTDFDTANESWVTSVMVTASVAACGRGRTGRPRAASAPRRRARRSRRGSEPLHQGGLPRSGLDGEQHAVVERDRARAARRSSLLTPRVDPGLEVLVAQREAQPVGARRRGAAAEREQRAQVARPRRGARPRSRTTDDARVADPRVDVERGERRRREQRAGWRAKWSSAAAVPADHDDSRAPARRRGVERELEVGGVLVGGCRSTTAPAAVAAASARRARPSRGRRPRGRRHSRARPRARAPSRPRSRRRPASRPSTADGGGRSPPANTSAARIGSVWSLRRHYPDQVRGVGDARRSPSQPG